METIIKVSKKETKVVILNMYENLRKIRNKKNVSAFEMKNLLGLKTVAAYYKKETGSVKLTLDEAKIISERLDMKIEDIFFENEVSNMDTTKDDNMQLA